MRQLESNTALHSRWLLPVRYFLAVLYGTVTYLRNLLYDLGFLKAYRAHLPVISVGNLSAGGNAKTPLCILLASELSNRGYKPVVLSRGYGGSLRKPHVVSGDDSPDTVGDEPYLIATTLDVPVVVARERVAGAKLIEQLSLGDLIILDDGLQHRRLARSVEIVSCDASTPIAIGRFLAGRHLPWGRFRENRQRAWSRIDMVVFATRSTAQLKQDDLQRLRMVVPTELSVYQSRINPIGIEHIHTGAPLSGKSVVAFCGLGNPAGFFETLVQMGYTVRAKYPFPDHHKFTESDLELLRQNHPAAPLICTEKDAVKLRELAGCDVFQVKTETLLCSNDSFFKELLNRLDVGAPGGKTYIPAA